MVCNIFSSVNAPVVDTALVVDTYPKKANKRTTGKSKSKFVCKEKVSSQGHTNYRSITHSEYLIVAD